MRIGICSIGTELVVGDQVDTNAAWLAQRLLELGASPDRVVAVGDDLDAMVDTLRWLLDRCDGVIVGGGLGPTSDDRTREAIALVADVPLESRADLEEAIIQRFAELGARMPASNLVQAEVPAGAVGWPPVGTAPGFTVEVGGQPIWALPGVPWEMKALFDDHVAPDVLARSGGRATVTRIVHVAGKGESAVAEALAEIEPRAEADGVVVAYLATHYEVQVKLTGHGANPQEARAATQPWLDEVVERLGSAVAGVDAESVEQAVQILLKTAGRTVAVAESATAGRVCSRIASVPGASAVLRGGAVVYATETKAAIAGVDPGLLETHPAVSAEVTAALATSIRERFGADYGVATTGSAGPTPQDGVPVGQVYWALAGPDGEAEVHGRYFPGDRDSIQGRLATAALELLRRRLVAERAG